MLERRDEKMDKFLILQDKRGYTANSLLSGAGQKIDVELLKDYLVKSGALVEIRNLHSLVFPTEYNGWYVIYPSSEDSGLFYKGYIEDILLRLTLDGAILLPRFELFRAHHNKVFMESYRTLLSEEYNSIMGFSFYGIDDLKNKLDEKIKYPIVLKTASGSGSSGVALAYSKEEALKKARQMTKVIYYDYNESRIQHFRHILGKIKRKIVNRYILEKPKLQEKMICQTYVPGLTCDYKVLVFGEKYYLLRRKTRKNDFRASGSGLLEFPEEFTALEKNVLDFAKGAYEQLDSPLLSIDIAYDGKKCHMIEFQCLNFGPYTLQFSDAYYHYVSGTWEKVVTKSVLEEEMAAAYIRYVRKSGE